MFQIANGVRNWASGRGILTNFGRILSPRGANYGVANLSKIPQAELCGAEEKPSRIKKFKEFKIPGADKPAQAPA